MIRACSSGRQEAATPCSNRSEAAPAMPRFSRRDPTRTHARASYAITVELPGRVGDSRKSSAGARSGRIEAYYNEGTSLGQVESAARGRWYGVSTPACRAHAIRYWRLQTHRFGRLSGGLGGARNANIPSLASFFHRGVLEPQWTGPTAFTAALKQKCAAIGQPIKNRTTAKLFRYSAPFRSLL